MGNKSKFDTTFDTIFDTTFLEKTKKVKNKKSC